MIKKLKPSGRFTAAKRDLAFEKRREREVEEYNQRAEVDAQRNDAAQAFVNIIAERITTRELWDLLHLAQKAEWNQISGMLYLKLEKLEARRHAMVVSDD